MNKSLFTAMKNSTGNAGGCGCVPAVDSKLVYNINATWLKGVNSTALSPVYDMGSDGNLVAKDACSFGLNYFQNDYSPINSSVSPFPGL